MTDKSIIGADATAEAAAPAAPVEKLADHVMPDNEVKSLMETVEKEVSGDEANVAPEGAAETVYELKMPEGYSADPGLVSMYETFARENGIGNDGAQQGIELYIKAREMETVQQQRVWLSEVGKDPEIGGKNLPVTLAYAKTAAERFGGQKLVAALEETGIGNHPEVIRMFARIGRAMSETKHVENQRVAGKSKDDLADRLFPGFG